VAAQAPSRLKVASFTVRATMAQSAAWKRAAEAEGHASVGTWAADALDAYLKVRAQAGKPLPLFWSKGRFRVCLEDGTEPELRGWIARPFGIFHGNHSGAIPTGSTHAYSLLYLPQGRILATFRTAAHCKALASELGRAWVRWGGQEPTEDPAPLLQRFQREEA
jgi:hypothetical protein